MSARTRAQTAGPFHLAQGREIGGKYIVEHLLGGGWEGEVYRVSEKRTGAARAIKLFYPERNPGDRAVTFYAKKLEKLRACPIVIKYHHSETIRHRGRVVTALVSEFVEGVILDDLVASRPGRRLPEYEALRIFYELVLGLEAVHAEREYHGDLHSGNVLVQRRGVHFDVKLVDLFDHGRPSRANAQFDVLLLVRLLYDMLGGRRRYAGHSPECKRIICGLRHSLILSRYPTMARLRSHLDRFEWCESF
ncbi:MAG: protein kinase domain-containing protein [Phycisphaerales bacterium]